MIPNSNSGMSAPVDRRRFITGTLVLGAAIAAEQLPFATEAAARGRVHRWSDRRTWRGRVPGRNAVVRIDKRVLLDRNARVAGVIIERGGELIFHSGKRITLASSGNVIVRGRLKMNPRGPRDLHRLQFVGVNERRYKGGGMTPLRSDVGLWVIGGVLDARGSDKRAWARAAGGISAGARQISLRQSPDGWKVGDDIVITPTLPPSRSGHAEAFDRATITGIKGRTIKLSRATKFAHPSVEVAPRRNMTAEVLNLSRNVVIQGTPRGRAHIKISSHNPQTIKNVDIRYMGPRQKHKSGEYTKKILGRWALHFHHSGHGSHGSYVRGVVVRDSGAHAFVAHESHGVLFKDCIAYNNLETPFWWDEPTKKDPSRTKATIYHSCVAALVNFDPPHRGGSELSGFKMAQGENNRAVNCVAVGVLGQGWGDSAGFGWQSHQGGLWGFEGCVAHNNKNLGTRFWKNEPSPHKLEGFLAYHNGRYGSFDGAYSNGLRYVDCVYYGNGKGPAIAVKATSGKSVPRTRDKAFTRLRIDQGGASDFCIEFADHVNDPDGRRTVVRGCDFRGYKKAALGFTHVVRPSANVPDLVDVIDCSFGGNEFWLGSEIHPKSRIRVMHPRLGTIQLARWDQLLEGDLVLQWNARVKEIQPFD